MLAKIKASEKAFKEDVKKAKKLRKSKLATLQALKILNVSLLRFKNVSTISAIVGFLIWYLVSLNFAAAAIMAALAYQLPGIWYEQKGAKAFNQLQKQISIFVGAYNDVFFSGRTVRDALETAARSIKAEPMERYTGMFLRRLSAGENEAVALDALAQEIDHPSFRFFADLVKSVRISGDKSEGFKELDWKFREEESIQAEVKGEIFMYMAFTIIMFALDPGVILVYRLFFPDVYKYVPTHLGWVTILGALGSIVVFNGIRKFSRLRVTI